MKRVWHAHPMTPAERRRMEDRWLAELRLAVLERLAEIAAASGRLVIR